jgi:hypothetical protein
MSHHMSWYIGHQNILSKGSKLRINESPYGSIYCTSKCSVKRIKIKNRWVTICLDILGITMCCQGNRNQESISHQMARYIVHQNILSKGSKSTSHHIDWYIDMFSIKMFCQENKKMKIYESSYGLIYRGSKYSIEGIKIFYRRDRN